MPVVEICNGQNIIDIIFDDFASCLVVKRALVVNWPDCRGSIGEYYAISSFSTQERNNFTGTLNEALIEGTDQEQIEAVKSFLELFANGKYSVDKLTLQIDKTSFLANNSTTYAEGTPRNERFSNAFFPCHWIDNSKHYIFSITNEKIDRNRVNFYCDLIAKGKKPSILTSMVYNELTGNYSCSYVLDGHHKIEAYLRMKENIPAISIIKSEECTKKTGTLLQLVKPILQDFEYKHLFENSDENLMDVDFVNNLELTIYLDELLLRSEKIDLAVIGILKKFSDSKNNNDLEWLDARIGTLKENDHLNTFEGLGIYEQSKDMKRGNFWLGKRLKSKFELDLWIKKTLYGH
ncbi:hypothetical protein [Desertivirga brevis]|uniref:hypothetical protein n=1 Tax=Desertivirga brevis TaxID=2810310 RepID=UPI001A960774|nr:hypothetical protein [Pedobacter sp. SYSU D00873]